MVFYDDGKINLAESVGVLPFVLDRYFWGIIDVIIVFFIFNGLNHMPDEAKTLDNGHTYLASIGVTMTAWATFSIISAVYNLVFMTFVILLDSVLGEVPSRFTTTGLFLNLWKNDDYTTFPWVTFFSRIFFKMIYFLMTLGTLTCFVVCCVLYFNNESNFEMLQKTYPLIAGIIEFMIWFIITQLILNTVLIIGCFYIGNGSLEFIFCIILGITLIIRESCCRSPMNNDEPTEVTVHHHGATAPSIPSTSGRTSSV